MKHLFPGATGHFSLIQGCYWMTYCILISFSSLYLLDRGFTNTQIGLLLGVAGLTAAILQPFVGAKGDHLKVLSLRQFTSLPIAAMILCGVGLFLVPAKPVQAALYMVLLVLLQLLMDITPFGYDNDLEFCQVLAKEVGVGAVPGSSFFLEPVNHLIRFHFAKKDETLNEALNRLEAIHKKIPKRK